MIKGLGKAQIYVGDKLIGEVENVEMSTIDSEIEVHDFNEPISVSYEGTLTMTNGTIETPKEDERIGSRILPKYFKSIALGKDIYGRISRSLDKLGVKK